MKEKIKPYIALHGLVMLYSLGSVCSKAASKQEFLSVKFILFYGLLIFILGIYSIVWQQILKVLPLNTAYANKAVNIIWVMIWGVVIYHETITVNMVIGAVIILAGVVLIASGEKQDGKEHGDE